MSDEIDLSVVQLTRESLSPFISKPPLTDKLLKKPPFKFLHDLITQVIKQHGLLAGLFNEHDSLSENVKDKEAKMAFLQKVVNVMEFISGERLSIRPGKVVAGLEVANTNKLLQVIGRALANKADSSEAVAKVLAGEKLAARRSKSKEQKSSKPALSSSTGETKERKDKQGRQEKESRRSRSKHSKDSELSSEKSRLVEDTSVDNAGALDNGKSQQAASSGQRGEGSEEENRREEKVSGVSNGNGVSANGTPAHVTGSSKQKRSKTDNAAAGGDSSSVVREPRKERRSKSRDLDDKLTGKTEHRVKERRASKDKHAQNGKEKEKSSKEKKDRESKKDSKKDKEAKGESKKDRDSKKSRDSKKDKEVKKERTSQNARADKKDGFSVKAANDTVKDSTGPTDQAKTDEQSGRKRSISPVTSSAPPGDDFVQLNDVSVGRDPARPSTARTRPGSARAAPPPSARARSRAGLVVEQLVDDSVSAELPPAAAVHTAAIILDSSAADHEEEQEDAHFDLVQDDQPPDIMSGEITSTGGNVESAVAQASDGQHGRLVSQIIETKRNMEQQMTSTLPESKSGDHQSGNEPQQLREQEAQQLLECVQNVTRSANPLGKMIDFLQEDVDSMKRELDSWRQERLSLLARIQQENEKTESSIEPLMGTLSELQLSITEQTDKIGALRGTIVADAHRIDKLLCHVLKVAQ